MKFRGLCLGGPRDGQVAEHHAPTMPVMVRRSAADWTEPAGLDERALSTMQTDVHRVLYRHTPLEVNVPDLKRDGPVEFGFWIPEGEPAHGVAIVARLVGGYRSPS